MQLEESLLNIFRALDHYAILISIILNVLISVLGIIPSFIITAVNLKFFGFEHGIIISIIGEAFGAIVSFYLYRKGIKKIVDKNILNRKYVTGLMTSGGIAAFFMIIALRIFPFIPSGVVTLAGAISKVGIIHFSVASTIGKIPSLLIEAYSIQQVLQWNWEGKVLLSLFSCILIGIIYINRKK
ncbi:VTT domain-containing protein [Rossellomorea sp. AcN35-11]|nr:VTT domain-containing protein [Rossellomorea sp. AcN35-11]